MTCNTLELFIKFTPYLLIIHDFQTMQTSTIIELYHFQFKYLKRLVENIPNDRLYELQLDGYNSVGWILGHLCIEAEDPLNFLNIKYKGVNENWSRWFRISTGKITSLKNLPTKKELLATLDYRYQLLINAYSSLTTEERASPNPSKFLENVFTNLDSWFSHHIVTHIAVHCGNITVWKKMIKLEVGGY